MWFGFGIITLVIAVVVGLKTRLAASWKGQPFAHRRGNGRVQEIRTKGKLVRMRIGIDAAAHFNFMVRAEGMRDRMFKRLGVSVEIQTKDEEFDSSLYVESDARGVAILLKRRADVRRTLIDLFALGRQADLKSMRLRCVHRVLWVDCRPTSGQRAPLEEIVDKLHDLREALVAGKVHENDLHDRFVWRAAAVLAFSTGSLVLGILGVLRTTFGRTDILESGSLFFACAIPGSLLAIVMMGGIVGWLGASSRAHTVLIEFLLVGVTGIVLSSFALGREMNIELDFKPAKSYVLEGVRAEHKVTRGRRGRTRHHYYLHTKSWEPAHSSAFKRLEISADDYRRLNGTDEVVAFVKPGALGFDWVEKLEPSWGGPE